MQDIDRNNSLTDKYHTLDCRIAGILAGESMEVGTGFARVLPPTQQTIVQRQRNTFQEVQAHNTANSASMSDEFTNQSEPINDKISNGLVWRR